MGLFPPKLGVRGQNSHESFSNNSEFQTIFPPCQNERFFFLLGLGIGLSFYFYRSYRINNQLNAILQSISQFELLDSFSTIAQIKRNITLLNTRCYYTQLELNLYREIINKHPLGYLRINNENCLIECNLKAKKLLHINRWNPDTLRLFLELVRSYELDRLIQQTRKTQENLTIEWQFFPTTNFILEEENNDEDSNYEPIFLKAYSFPLPNDEVAIIIENQQLLKDLIIRGEQAYSDLSHELRTPLTSMLLLAETLEKYVDKRGLTWVKQIHQEVNRLIDLVQGWLEIYQLKQNPYQTLKFQKLDLKQLIISAWQSLIVLAEKENISLTYEGKEIITLEADLNRLTQVFVNLFDNSIKHCSKDGEIIVNLSQKISNDGDKFVEINVIDSGSGFNPQDLPYIFERLYRGDKSRIRTSRGGSGLGLSIVKEIIEAHQGSINAYNHPETRGAWLKIKLPLKQS